MRAWQSLLVGLLIVCGAAWAQPYPDKSRPIKVISTAGPGSAGDAVARAVARGITEVSGLNAVVENKPGAEGVIAVQALKGSAPDGYTLLVASSSVTVLNPHMQANLPYDPATDFVPLAAVGGNALAMSAGSTTTFKTAREFIAAARAAPGRYTFGSGTATTRLAGELLQRLAGIELVSVPYKSVAASGAAIAGGQVDVVFTDIATAQPQYDAGRARPLAVTGAKRMSALPNVPTMREEGVADYDIFGWYGTYFPAKTPPAIAATMREIIRKAAKTRQMAEMMHTFAMDAMDVAGDDLAALQRAESEKWGKLIRTANLAPLK